MCRHEYACSTMSKHVSCNGTRRDPTSATPPPPHAADESLRRLYLASGTWTVPSSRCVSQPALRLLPLLQLSGVILFYALHETLDLRVFSRCADDDDQEPRGLRLPARNRTCAEPLHMCLSQPSATLLRSSRRRFSSTAPFRLQHRVASNTAQQDRQTANLL